MEQRDKILEIERLSFQYRSELVLKQLKLTVYAGEMVGLIGESGCGKSTLLKAVASAYEDGGQLAGAIRCCGKAPGSSLAGAVIGFVFQDCRASFCPVRTIAEQLYEFASIHLAGSRKQVMKEAVTLLEAMQIKEPKELLKRYPFEVSGGEIQRIGMMMALLPKPALLLADEPTAALDQKASKALLQLLKERQQKDHFAMLVVSHDHDSLFEISDRIVLLKDGQITEVADESNVTG